MACAVRPEGEALFASALGQGLRTLKLEIEDHERQAIERSLAECRSRLIEKAEDTTLMPARRRAGIRELSVITSVLRKLRPPNRRAQLAQAAKAGPGHLAFHETDADEL